MGQPIIFVIDLPLPPTALSPNTTIGSTYQRLKKARAIREYQALVSPLLISRRDELGWVAPRKARISLCYCVAGRGKKDGRYRPMDYDNAVGAFKAGQDSLVLSGVLVADDFDHLEGGTVTRDKLSGPYVRVTIERLG